MYLKFSFGLISLQVLYEEKLYVDLYFGSFHLCRSRAQKIIKPIQITSFAEGDFIYVENGIGYNSYY